MEKSVHGVEFPDNFVEALQLYLAKKINLDDLGKLALSQYEKEMVEHLKSNNHDWKRNL